ncbi:transglycosylase domain-containing protein [Paenibacillus silvae]|uniref:transglycosylase domain-containing protein n=1 Tax=Paenibacillus silvae TaxID=1325358 RepID=UPI0020064E10|nr:PBP1A family penicillin-binding protein [Paenibacillus silvae]MCK6074731.1 PBP1A family penicillin-binding protein [Paenibacillus silvae]MCK6147794.1 PBP1A family penicillin-binding protein [Paenibacillus silvae]MCK6266092.1 PBP1A family penicillin-binding protein [Paenibacillus silvae]
MLSVKVKRRVYRTYDVGVIAAVLLVILYVYLHTYGNMIVRSSSNVAQGVSSTIILDENGREITQLKVSGRGYAEYASLQDMPEMLVEAFLATEDRRFYRHSGLDVIGVGRAVVQNMIHMDWNQGGSSITQQLARNMYLNGNKTMIRKINELSLAIELEKKFSKDDILEMYLNQIYMGQQQYGVKAAALRYFGVKDLKQLELWQIATLAGMPKGPSIYNPVDNEKLSKERRRVVLSLMHQQGIITKSQMQEAAAVEYKPPRLALLNLSSTPAADGHEPAYVSAVDAVIQEAALLTGKSEAEISSAGWVVRTGLNPGAQRAMEETFAETIWFPDDREDQQVQASMVLLDQHNGEVKAMMGGRNPMKGDINRALIDARQPGSVFKPVIAYGPALESRKFTPESMLPDRSIRYGSYQPRNVGGRYRGTVSLSEALQQSINSPAVWLLNQIGLREAKGFAQRLGIELQDEDMNLSIALGGLHQGISPMKLAQAYAVFANEGRLNKAHLIREIRDAHGRVIYAHRSDHRQVISRRTAQEMTHMLQQVVSRGTGKRAQLPQEQVAGKTGTTQAAFRNAPKGANRDIWFAGYTREWTGVVWMGFDHTDAQHYLKSGSGSAAAMFAAVMKRAKR